MKPERLRHLSEALIFAAAGLGAALVLLATSKYGIAAISDSAAYVSAARNVAAGNGFVEWTGQPYVMWPPLYPMLLAMFEAGGIDALVAARWLNAALMAAIAVLGSFALKAQNAGAIISVLVALSIAVAPALLNEAIAVMSELLFVFLVVSCLVVLGRHLGRPSTKTLLAASLCGGLAWLTRYAGFTVVGVGAVLLVARGGRSIAVSLRESAVFLLVASTPMIAWLIRNHVVSDTATGLRHGSPYTFAELARLALQRIGEWFVPPSVGALASVAAGSTILALALVVVTSAVVSYFRRVAPRGQWWKTPLERSAVVFASFVVTYVVSITWLISVSFATNDPQRLVGPASVPVLILLGILLTDATRKQRRPWVRLAVAALLLVWPSRSAWGLLQQTRSVGAGGVASDRWRHSAIIANLRREAAAPLSANSVIYSNEPTAIYLLTGLTSVYWLPPHDNPYSPVPPRRALDDFARQLAYHEPTYIVLFDQVLADFIYPRPLVEAVLPVKSVFVADDGAVYRVDFSRQSKTAADPGKQM